MPDFDLILSRRKIRDGKLSVVIRNGIVRIIHNDDITLHPPVDGAFDIDRAGFLDFLFVHLPLNGLSDVEEAVVALKELDVVQYGITVTQRYLGVHRHDLNMR